MEPFWKPERKLLDTPGTVGTETAEFKTAEFKLLNSMQQFEFSSFEFSSLDILKDSMRASPPQAKSFHSCVV